VVHNGRVCVTHRRCVFDKVRESFEGGSAAGTIGKLASHSSVFGELPGGSSVWSAVLRMPHVVLALCLRSLLAAALQAHRRRTIAVFVHDVVVVRRHRFVRH